jgi:fumarate reductase subunit D
MSPWTRLEPLFWLLSMAGGICAALLLPAASFGFGVALPARWLGSGVATYDQLRPLLAHGATQLALATFQSLIFWHAAHQLRHLLRYSGVRSEALTCAACYPLAALASALSFMIWCRL